MPVDVIHSTISVLYLSIWLLIAHVGLRRKPTADIGKFNRKI